MTKSYKIDNNYCSVQGGSFNFDTWDTWAKSSKNPNVRVFLGLPGSKSAAGSGYVTAATLQSTIPSLRSQYSSFGGVMMCRYYVYHDCNNDMYSYLILKGMHLRLLTIPKSALTLQL